jgi:hypothetical protein
MKNILPKITFFLLILFSGFLVAKETGYAPCPICATRVCDILKCPVCKLLIAIAVAGLVFFVFYLVTKKKKTKKRKRKK